MEPVKMRAASDNQSGGVKIPAPPATLWLDVARAMCERKADTVVAAKARYAAATKGGAS